MAIDEINPPRRIWAVCGAPALNREAALVGREVLKGVTYLTKATGQPNFVRAIYTWASNKLETQIKEIGLVRASLVNARGNHHIKRDDRILERVVRMIEESK